jgi:hypothetical protein
MKEKLAKIGTGAKVQTEWGFYVNVIIKDYKNSYGNDRWYVEPLSGEGGAWVQKVIFETE